MVKKTNLILQFSKYKSISLDTSIFIYYLQNHPKYIEAAAKIFDYVEQKDIQMYLSTLLFTELFVDPYKKKQIDIAQKWLTYFKLSRNICMVDISAQIALTAARIRAEYNVKTPDSIHLATAIESGVKIFICNDLKLRKMKEIKVVCLDEYISKN